MLRRMIKRCDFVSNVWNFNYTVHSYCLWRKTSKVWGWRQSLFHAKQTQFPTTPSKQRYVYWRCNFTCKNKYIFLLQLAYKFDLFYHNLHLHVTHNVSQCIHENLQYTVGFILPQFTLTCYISSITVRTWKLTIDCIDSNRLHRITFQHWT